MFKKFIKKILTEYICFLYTKLDGKDLFLKRMFVVLFTVFFVCIPLYTLAADVICPSGFPTIPDDNDDNKCSVKFKFYAGKDATFRDVTFDSDDYGKEEIMYYRQESDLFEYYVSGGNDIHKLKGIFILGDQEPTRQGYTFSHWVWNGTPVGYDTNISSGGEENYRKIYAVWCDDSKNQVPWGYECVCKQGFFYDSETSKCTPCNPGFSTLEPGATSEEACKLVFGFGDTFWAWPDSVNQGKITNVKNYP